MADIFHHVESLSFCSFLFSRSLGCLHAYTFDVVLYAPICRFAIE